MPPPSFFQLWGYQNPKTEPWHIFCTKNNLKSHFDNFRFLSLAAKGLQSSKDIIKEKSKISKILSFDGEIHLKWKLKTCTIQIQLEKMMFNAKKRNYFFFDFLLMLKDPQKFSTSNFFNFLKNKLQNWLPGTYSGAKKYWHPYLINTIKIRSLWTET